MKLIESKLYTFVETLSSFFLLNLLWLLMCIPIFTIFPATAAMFGVVREWVLHKDLKVFNPFFRYFKENFKQSLLIGLVWIAFAGIFYIDYQIMLEFGSSQKIFLPILILLGTLIIFVTSFLFPVMVHYTENWIGILKNSLFFSVIYFPFSLLAIALIALIVTTLLLFPAALLFIFSIGAYSLFFICNLVFQKIERIKLAESIN
ncbi:YesL family protein [Fictibacillus enclensis]|uniref:YesL family protein n=1 Tax=Fictibacillus enclensis TaxID=1017270 RepID=UPI0025A2D658|nr:YesL family protein [Fictibacillus enclensis]MDM5199005.1 YesL family protein [Fictibacillus enclensis]